MQPPGGFLLFCDSRDHCGECAPRTTLHPEAAGPLADPNTRIFRGRALAILRSTGKAGAVRPQVTAAGLTPATSAIHVGS